jgi:ubiquinone/menaquinone biosynthesis C-methylase UbiE
MIITRNDIARPDPRSSLLWENFETMYIATRKKENRVYADEQVSLLPVIDPSHIHYSEWQSRKSSANRLFNYLKAKKKPLSILEVGCGNGWLSAWLATIPDADVTGIDIIETELEQAKRVFNKRPNLVFFKTDIEDIHVVTKKFDAVIFAASIQYFASPETVIVKALSLLNEDGEIHILDSHFYKASGIGIAKSRTKLYYQAIGQEGMASKYFHHTIESISRFNYKMLFAPGGIKNKLIGNKDPFPWVLIKK